MALKRTLYDDVFAAFARACDEGEFEIAEHLLRAIESIARQKQDSEKLDAAYALLARPDKSECVRPRRRRDSS